MGGNCVGFEKTPLSQKPWGSLGFSHQTGGFVKTFVQAKDFFDLSFLAAQSRQCLNKEENAIYYLDTRFLTIYWTFLHFLLPRFLFS